VAPAAVRYLRKLNPHIRKEVNRDILCLEEDPRPHGVQEMETESKLYRFYVGPGKNYRAIYQIRDEVLLVLVVRIGASASKPDTTCETR
jgi:mRNA interferase RelE/StbE